MIRYSEDDYYQWLLEQIELDRFQSKGTYHNLIAALHNYEFYGIVGNDNDRAECGIDLRDRFSYDTGFYYMGDPDTPCSVLEMMIALASDWEHEIMFDFTLGDRTANWFWCMVENLGLLGQTDDAFDDILVENTLFRLVNWEYEHDGIGGLFPLRVARNDQREVEIWYQLQSYLLENYDF